MFPLLWLQISTEMIAFSERLLVHLENLGMTSTRLGLLNNQAAIFI